MPELALPLAYTIPHEWGGVHVTESAHEAYGIVPLSADAVPGGYVETDKARPQVDVLLVGPDEFPHHGPMMMVKNQLYKGGLGIAVGFSHTKEELAELMQSGIGIRISLLGESLEADITGKPETGTAEQEALLNDIPQQIAHNLAVHAGESAINGLTAWALEREKQRAYIDIVATGSVGLVGFGIMLAVPLVTTGGAHAPELGLSTAYLAYSLNNTRRSLKRFMNSERPRLTRAKEQAGAYTGLVVHDLHSDFCSSHFDIANEALFEDESPTLPDGNEL